MTIAYLADHITFADDAATWIYGAFVEPVRDDLSYEQVLAKVKDCHKSQLPIRFVAILDGNCVGTVSLVHNDLKCRDYTPWLAALYVDESFRGRQIGERLLDHAKSIAQNLGYPALYLRTEHASNYYKKLGWQFVEACDDDFNLKPDVFKFTFA